jgi:hypothetical protein
MPHFFWHTNTSGCCFSNDSQWNNKRVFIGVSSSVSKFWPTLCRDNPSGKCYWFRKNRLTFEDLTIAVNIYTFFKKKDPLSRRRSTAGRPLLFQIELEIQHILRRVDITLRYIFISRETAGRVMRFQCSITYSLDIIRFFGLCLVGRLYLIRAQSLQYIII